MTRHWKSAMREMARAILSAGRLHSSGQVRSASSNTRRQTYCLLLLSSRHRIPLCLILLLHRGSCGSEIFGSYLRKETGHRRLVEEGRGPLVGRTRRRLLNKTGRTWISKRNMFLCTRVTQLDCFMNIHEHNKASRQKCHALEIKL